MRRLKVLSSLGIPRRAVGIFIRLAVCLNCCRARILTRRLLLKWLALTVTCYRLGALTRALDELRFVTLVLTVRRRVVLTFLCLVRRALLWYIWLLIVLCLTRMTPYFWLLVEMLFILNVIMVRVLLILT